MSGWDLTGVFGAIVLLFPDLYRKFATAFLYERPGPIEWNEGFSTVQDGAPDLKERPKGASRSGRKSTWVGTFLVRWLIGSHRTVTAIKSKKHI